MPSELPQVPAEQPPAPPPPPEPEYESEEDDVIIVEKKAVNKVGSYPDWPTLPHWAEAFRISRPASDLPHIHKIFRFQLKSDQHVFPVWTPMQLAWQSINYHDHSSLSCPLISWGWVKTETLPALCNKNNKPIDLIHLRCGWQLTLLRYAWCLRKMLPTKLCLKKMCLSQTCTHQKQTGTEIVTLKCVKKGK